MSHMDSLLMDCTICGGTDFSLMIQEDGTLTAFCSECGSDQYIFGMDPDYYEELKAERQQK